MLNELIDLVPTIEVCLMMVQYRSRLKGADSRVFQDLK